jgi:hypothetical protein
VLTAVTSAPTKPLVFATARSGLHLSGATVNVLLNT